MMAMDGFTVLRRWNRLNHFRRAQDSASTSTSHLGLILGPIRLITVEGSGPFGVNG